MMDLPPEKARDDERARVSRPYFDYLFAHFALNGFQWYDGSHEITKQIQFSGADVSFTCKWAHKLRYVEVKTDFHLPYNLCLETVSNTKVDPPIPGWAATSKADRLATGFVWVENVLDVFVQPFPELKGWLWKDDNYLNFRKHVVPNSRNGTESRIVPIKKIVPRVETSRYLITRDGNIFPVPVIGQHPIDIVRRVLEKRGYPFQMIDERRPF